MIFLEKKRASFCYYLALQVSPIPKHLIHLFSHAAYNRDRQAWERERKVEIGVLNKEREAVMGAAMANKNAAQARSPLSLPPRAKIWGNGVGGEYLPENQVY